MKRKKSFLFLLIFAGIFSSCSRRPIIDEMIEVNVVNKLISPADNSDMNLTKDLPPINFEWEEAEASQGITLRRELISSNQDDTHKNYLQVSNTNFFIACKFSSTFLFKKHCLLCMERNFMVD